MNINKIKKFCYLNVNKHNKSDEPYISFGYDDMVIRNPFYDENYISEVDTIDYYKEYFLESDFLKEGLIENVLKYGAVS